MGSRPPSQPARQERPPRRSMARESRTTLLPTRLSTASICFASGICCARSRRRLGPLAPAHMQLGMVDAEGLDLNDHMAGLGLRLGNVLVNQAVEAAEFLQNDRAHD